MAGIYKYFKGLNGRRGIRSYVLFGFSLQLQSAEKLKSGSGVDYTASGKSEQTPGIRICFRSLRHFIFTATLLLCCRFIRP